jgi:hypothetical protein
VDSGETSSNKQSVEAIKMKPPSLDRAATKAVVSACLAVFVALAFHEKIATLYASGPERATEQTIYVGVLVFGICIALSCLPEILFLINQSARHVWTFLLARIRDVSLSVQGKEVSYTPPAKAPPPSPLVPYSGSIFEPPKPSR